MATERDGQATPGDSRTAPSETGDPGRDATTAGGSRWSGAARLVRGGGAVACGAGGTLLLGTPWSGRAPVLLVGAFAVCLLLVTGTVVTVVVTAARCGDRARRRAARHTLGDLIYLVLGLAGRLEPCAEAGTADARSRPVPVARALRRRRPDRRA